MVFWIVVGVIVLGLFALCFVGADRYRHRDGSASEMEARSNGMRNSGGGFGI